MLKRSMFASGALHAGVILAAAVTWPRAPILSDEPTPVVPVELVTIAEETNIAPTVKDPPKPEPLPEIPPAHVEIPTPTPLQLAELEPEPEAAPPPEPVPEAPKPPEPKVETAAAPPRPALPRRKPKPDPAQQFNVDSVLALLDKRAAKTAPTPANAKRAETTLSGLGAQNAFSLDLRDALLAQMRECWNVPVGAPNPEQLIVQVRVFLTQDGSLAQPPQLEAATRAAASVNPYVRTAAEAALRAVNVCEPYKRLPPERYTAWREIVMTFDPSKIVGR